VHVATHRPARPESAEDDAEAPAEA